MQSGLEPKQSWMQVAPTEEFGLKRGMLALALKIPAALRRKRAARNCNDGGALANGTSGFGLNCSFR